MEPTFFQLATMILGPTGAAWVAVKVSLNGTRARVQRIEQSVDRISDSVSNIREDVAYLKGQTGGRRHGDG